MSYTDLRNIFKKILLSSLKESSIEDEEIFSEEELKQIPTLSDDKFSDMFVLKFCEYKDYNNICYGQIADCIRNGNGLIIRIQIVDTKTEEEKNVLLKDISKIFKSDELDNEFFNKTNNKEDNKLDNKDEKEDIKNIKGIDGFKVGDIVCLINNPIRIGEITKFYKFMDDVLATVLFKDSNRKEDIPLFEIKKCNGIEDNKNKQNELLFKYRNFKRIDNFKSKIYELDNYMNRDDMTFCSDMEWGSNGENLKLLNSALRFENKDFRIDNNDNKYMLVKCFYEDFKIRFDLRNILIITEDKDKWFDVINESRTNPILAKSNSNIINPYISEDKKLLKGLITAQDEIFYDFVVFDIEVTERNKQNLKNIRNKCDYAIDSFNNNFLNNSVGVSNFNNIKYINHIDFKEDFFIRKILNTDINNKIAQRDKNLIYVDLTSSFYYSLARNSIKKSQRIDLDDDYYVTDKDLKDTQGRTVIDLKDRDKNNYLLLGLSRISKNTYDSAYYFELEKNNSILNIDREEFIVLQGFTKEKSILKKPERDETETNKVTSLLLKGVYINKNLEINDISENKLIDIFNNQNFDLLNNGNYSYSEKTFDELSSIKDELLNKLEANLEGELQFVVLIKII